MAAPMDRLGHANLSKIAMLGLPTLFLFNDLILLGLNIWCTRYCKLLPLVTYKHEATSTLHKVLTLLLLSVVVLLVNVHSVIYGVRQQLKGVHHLNVSPLLLPDESSNHCATQDIKTSHCGCLSWSWTLRHSQQHPPHWDYNTHTLHRPAFLRADAYPVVRYVEDDQRV